MWADRSVHNLRTAIARANVLVLLLVALGCGGSGSDSESTQTSPPDPSSVLAQVGEQTITEADLRSFYERMPESLQSDHGGIEGARNHLQTLIDMELLRIAALDRGVDTSAAFVAKMRQHVRDRLVGHYIREHVRVSVSNDEVKARLAEMGLTRRLRVAQIVTANHDSALQALADIGSGVTFSDAAQRWSIHDETAELGGDTGRYVRQSQLPENLGPSLFGMNVGDISEPYELGNGAWAIYTILTTLEEDEDADAEAFANVYRELYTERHAARRAALVDSLADVANVELDEAGFAAFLQGLRTADWRAIDSIPVVFRYRDGQVDGAEAIGSFDPMERGDLAQQNPDTIKRRMLHGAVGDELLLIEAHAKGYAERPEVAGALQRNREQELIVQLRVQILDERLHITDDDVRREFEQNPDRYRRPVQVQIQEVLLESEVEAAELLQQLRGGESIAAHVSRTLRPAEQRDESGRLTLTLADATRGYGRLAVKAYLAETGQIEGPVHVPGGYSVFQVLSRHAEPATFAEAERRARATARYLRKQVLFEAFLEEVRSQYADRVTIDEANLRQVAGV